MVPGSHTLGQDQWGRSHTAYAGPPPHIWKSAVAVVEALCSSGVLGSNGHSVVGCAIGSIPACGEPWASACAELAPVSLVEGLPLQHRTVATAGSKRVAFSGGAKLGGRRINLSDADLREIRLRDADLCGADLSRAVLYGADLSNADLTGATLVDADLYGASLPGAVLLAADLRNAKLRAVDLRSADLTGADLRDAKLNRGGRGGRDNSRRPTDLTGAKLVRANLSRANLTRATLVRVDLTGADLRGAILRGAVLHLASLYGAILEGADLTGADLRGATYDTETRWPVGFKPPE